jgi:AcrR family transcriptional regulator
LLQAAATLISRGLTPTTTEVAEEAGVSRRTAYRYFPTQEQLLVEASLERLRPTVEEAMDRVKVVPSPTPEAASDATEAPDVAWARARLDATVRVMHRLALEHEPLLRTIQQLTAGGQTSPKIRPRGSRRVDWLTAAVEPVRDRLGPRRFSRLVSALCSCVGFDSLFVLRDIRGLSPNESERVTRWMASTLLQASVAEALETSRGHGKQPGPGAT